MNCILCQTDLPEGRRIYCSQQCVKRAYYIRNLKSGAKSSFTNLSGFSKTETGKGLIWEKYIAKLLGAEHLIFNGSGPDLILNGENIDVKSANIYKRKNKRGKPVVGEQAGVWVFNRNKPKRIDWFVCVCLIDNKPLKILRIPAKEFGNKGVVVGRMSKYDKYQIY